MKLTWILNWTEIRSFSSVQFRSKKFVPASSALSSVQFRSKKRGRIFWTRINAQKRSKNAPKRPKTPQNAPKRPKNAPKRPKNARFLDLKTPVFFSSVQFRSVFSGQVSSGHFRSVQVKYLTWSVVQVSSVQVNLTCRTDTAKHTKLQWAILNITSSKTCSEQFRIICFCEAFIKTAK